MTSFKIKVPSFAGLTVATVLVLLPALSSATAQEAVDLNPALAAATTTSQPRYHNWMNPEIRDAWALGYQGKGVTITIVDDFGSSSKGSGNLGTGSARQRHGEWVRDIASMIAPQGTMAAQDFKSGRRVNLAQGLNVINLSYAVFAASGLRANQIGWTGQESSIIQYAKDGRAIVSKAAGNDAVAVGSATRNGQMDYLNRALIGTPSAIFAGALDRNGTPQNPARLASYSNFAGSDVMVQNQFVLVGVRNDLTGLNGTSYAAPIISGYAAVIGSKFTKASATQIRDQILNTARQDTILDFDPARHGRGEASITRALAPASIR